MKKIRVLFTIPNFDTAGSGKAMLNLALGLDQTLFEPHIMCAHDRGAFFPVVANSGIPVHVYPYLVEARPILSMIMNCFKVSKKFRSIQPDIIHSFNYSANYTEAIASVMAGIPWTFTKKSMSWGGSSANSWKLRSFLARGIIVQNTDMIKQFYPGSKKISLIPRGVVIKNFIASEPRSEIREKMKTLPHQRIVICVANFVPVKGIELLIEAFGKLQPSHADWTLWLVGDDENEYGKNLHQRVSQSGLSEHIIFSGKQSDVKSYLNHAEVFVLPTKDEGRREGSPVALLEAMANSKVVLASRVPGVKDQLQSFPDSIFTPSDVNDLTEKLGRLMNKSKSELTLLGKSFFDFVSTRYPIDIEITKHQQHYYNMLGKDLNG